MVRVDNSPECYRRAPTIAGSMAAAHHRGLRVPDEIAVVGMDHTPLSGDTIPQISTAAYDLTAGGQTLPSIVLDELARDEVPAAHPEVTSR